MPGSTDLEFLAFSHVVRERRARRAARPDVFVVVIDGAVSVGKSTSAQMLAGLLDAPPETLAVEVVSTDGFLLPNDVLNARGLMMRKGFPESYDHESLDAFVASVRDGARELHAPLYSHDAYDVIGETHAFPRPDVLILEGLHTTRLADVVDLAVFVDAHEADIERWYTERLLHLRAAGSGFYAQFASLSDRAAAEFAHQVWEEINAPNLHDHILPNRAFADVVVFKGSDHAVQRLTLRENERHG